MILKETAAKVTVFFCVLGICPIQQNGTNIYYFRRFIHPMHPHITEIISHLNSFNGDIPRHRRESKRQYTLSKLPFEEQLIIWDMIWKQYPGFYPRLHAFFFLERHIKTEAQLRHLWPVIVHWQDEVDDWGLCDALAKIYTRMLEIMPDEVYPQLVQWNTNKNLWKRRQSVVSLLYYSRTKKSYHQFNQIMPLLARLVNDKEYYVQKGLGWSLREVHNVYPDETFAWLKENIRSISAIAFSPAIEKMDADNVSELKALRKEKN
jgi:3-methyladenine DNA glycosylase AlkD